MKYVRISNLTRAQAQPIRAGYCDSFLCRLRGLMFRRSLGYEESLLLVQNRDSLLDSGIHMMFMNFDLAVVWINSSNEVVDVRLAQTWKPAYIPKNPARYVLEMHASRLTEFEIGDQVQIVEENTPA